MNLYFEAAWALEEPRPGEARVPLCHTHGRPVSFPPDFADSSACDIPAGLYI